MFRFLLIWLGCCWLVACRTSRRAFNKADVRNDSLIVNLLHQHSAAFDSLLQSQEEYGIQIIYTQIDRNKNGRAVLTDHFFNVSDRYFYPASTVKLPIALLTLERLNRLKRKGIDKNTTMITEAAYSGQTFVYNDPSSQDGRPTPAHYIKKIFLVSDNDAFNRLYEFLGQQYINKRLHKLGYRDSEILHRLSIALSEDENRHTNPVNFYDSAGRIVYRKPPQFSTWTYANRNDKKGNGHYAGDQLIHEPFDFSKKNRLSLQDLHTMLKTIFFPREFKRRQRFKLRNDDYQFVYKYMSMFPRESSYPSYDSTYHDAYSKFIFWGETTEKLDGSIRIFHKSGEAYGFLTDVCYVVDFKNNIEFMLSATIHCNRDGIYNDDKYDYESTGLPFLKNLGQVFYNYELKRERKYKPDLSFVTLNYAE